MKWAVPALCAAVLAVTGCSRNKPSDRPLDGVAILGAYHRAEESTAYTVKEANDLVVSKAWPVGPSAASPSGFLVYGRPVATVFQHTHHGPDQWRLSVLSASADPTAAGMIQARNGQSGWRYVPEAGQLQLETYPAKDVGAINWLALILSNYRVDGVRPDRIVGTKALYLEVRPRYNGRPMKRLWVDAETYLPLRQELWSADGRLLSVTQALERPTPIPAGDFTDLRPPALPGVAVVQWEREYRLSEPEIAAALGFRLGHLTSAPPGFASVGSYLSIRPDTSGACARWEMTDGLATVNITQARKGLAPPVAGTLSGDVQGPVVAVSRGPYHFIVRGNVSHAELRRIADCIAL